MIKQLTTSFMALGLLFTGFAQKNETITGTGPIINKEIPVSGFDALKVSGIFELRLSQGSTEKLVIEANENLQQYFTVKNNGSKLEIDMEKLKNKNLKGDHLKMVVHITFKHLKEMNLNTVGNIRSEETLSFGDLKISNNSVGNVDLQLTAKQFALNNQSVGNISLAGSADHAVIKNEGVGALKAGDFVVPTMNIENEGVGQAEVNATKELKVSESFLSKVKNRGAAPIRKKGKVVI